MRPLLVALTVVVFCGCPLVDPCSAPGERTVTITSSGLPAGVDGTIHVNGQTVTNSGTVTLSTGQVVLSADAVAAPSANLVRTAYLPTFDPDDECVAPDAGLPIAANWAPVPTSSKVWTVNQNGTAQLVGLDTFSLDAGHDEPVTAAVGVQTDVGQFTFDQRGNVWAVQGTLASSALNFYTASDFASSGARTPSVKLGVSALSGCIPGASALAFDAQGDLWLASLCDNAVYKLSRDSLGASGTIGSLAKLTVPSPGGLAFDAAGRLFVASKMDGRVYRFDASQLNADATEPAAKIGVRVSTDTGNTAIFSASWLAFDSHGALWFNDFGANTYASIPSASLNGAGSIDVQPGATVLIDVAALLENFAFDEQGGLWSGASSGKVLRLSADQLTGFFTPGTPTVPERVLQSPDLAYVNGVALYPAPAGLPLFHALP